MYLKHFKLKQAPFSIPPDNQIFFPGGGRGKVLQHILEDLSSGINLVHLCGEKGSGKTFLCQLIRDKLRSIQTVVLLSEPSDTSDDHGHSIALDTDENDAKHIAGTKLYEKILLLISNRADNGDAILLIIDDAEKLEPSVLTHILRLACDAQPQRAVQFVLAGRLPLGANPEQFAAIRAEPLQQFTYTLQPLDRDDTAHYLAFRLTIAGIPDDKKDGVFSTEAISKIHEATCGNIFLINILAEEALHNSCEGKSFIVLLDHVKPPSDFSTALPISINRPSELLRTPRKILAVIIALIIIATIWTYNVIQVDTKTKQQIEEPSDSTQEVQSSLTENFPSSSLTQTVPSLLPVVETEGGRKAQIQTKNNPQKKTTKAVRPPLPVVASEAGENLQILTKKNPEKKTRTTEKTKIVLLAADQTLKVRHKVEGRIDIPEKKQTNVNLSDRLTPRELYKKRTIAGDLWIKGEKNGLYTLQLMALKARNAETNMKQMLNQKRYRQHADNFYIFRKKTVPETVFVFYGEYNDIAAARLAQRSIPDFLKAHQPYAISIKEAMVKLRK